MNAKFMPSALLVSLSLALFGCGGDDSAKKQQPASGEPQQSPAAASGDLAEKQEITINNGAEPESLDPHKVSGVPESNLLRQMLVGLTSNDANGKTVPGMAESWESADNKVWTFKLRDAKWSNGDPVTAHDFVYSIVSAVWLTLQLLHLMQPIWQVSKWSMPKTSLMVKPNQKLWVLKPLMTKRLRLPYLSLYHICQTPYSILQSSLSIKKLSKLMAKNGRLLKTL